MAQVTVEAKYIADTAQYVQALRRAAEATNALADSLPGVENNQRQFAAGTRDAGEAAQEASKGFTILRNAMGTAIGVAAVNMITKITGNLRSFAMASFDAAARVEELDIAMRAIGESTGLGTQAIQEATQAIRDNGIELGAAQQIAIEFAQNQLDLASASKVARVAQDLAVIAGKNSTATTQLLTRAIITGNSMLLKSAGISRQAGEAYKEYAEQLGKTTKQLTAVERQQAVTNLIIAEGEKVAGTYEASMDAAGKVLRSFRRIINDIQVEIGRLLLEAFGPLIKTTYDLLSAFSRTLREGGSFADTMTSIADVMQKLTQPLVSFIENLTRAVRSGEALERVNRIMVALVPVVESLFAISQAWSSVLWTGLTPALQALASLLDAVLSLIAPLLNAFNAMPQAGQAAVAMFILLQIAMAKSAKAALLFGMSFSKLALTVKVNVGIMIMSTRQFGATLAATLAASRAQIGLFATTVKALKAGTVLAFRAIAAAARGLLAALGPVGVALIALTVAFEVFSGRSAAAEEIVRTLKDSVDELTGAFGEASVAAAAAQFRADLSSEDIQRLQEMGITVADMAQAALAGGAAADEMRSKLQGLIGEAGFFSSDRSMLIIAERNFGGMVKASNEARRELEADAAARADAAAVEARKTAEAAETRIMATRAEAMRREQELHNLSASERHLHEVREKQVKQQQASMNALEATTVAAVEAMKTAFSGLKDALNLEANVDSAHDALLKMREQLRGSTEGVEGFSKGAKDNRKVIRDYGNQMMQLAQSMTDPRDQMETLIEAEKQVRKELKKKDIRPEDSATLQAIQGAIAEAENAVADMGDAAAQAEQSGIDVTRALVEGIVTSIEDNKGTLDAAGRAAADPLIEGLMNEMEIGSPSKVAIRAGNDFVAGLVKGLRDGNNELASAMRLLVRQGINAAKDEAGIASPSTKAIGMGHDIADGLAIGMDAHSRRPKEAAKNTVRGMFDEMGAEVRDTSNSARRVLSEAQKTGAAVAASFARGMSTFRFDAAAGSLMDQLQSALGTLPSLPNPLEQLLGKDGAEAWLKRHEKSLVTLQKTFMDVDTLVGTVHTGAASLRQIHSAMTGVQGLYKGEPIESPSELLMAIGPEGNLSGAVGMMQQMSQDIDTAFNSLIATVGRGQRAAVRAQRDAAAGYMQAMQSEIAGLMIRRDEIRRELAAIDKTYNENVGAINKHYGRLIKDARRNLNDLNKHHSNLIRAQQNHIRNLQRHYQALEKSARANLDATRKHYEAMIPPLRENLKAATAAFDAENKVLEGLIQKRDQFTERIQSGFRSFVNSLTFETSKATKEIVRESKKMANGITVTFEREIEVGGKRENIAAALQGRLDAVREFAANIRTLMQRGVDPSLVQEFVSAGVSGAGDVVAELAAVSADEIAQINAVQMALASEIADFQEYGVQQFHAAAIAQQEAIVAPLETARDQAEAALELAEASRVRDLESAQAHLDSIMAMRDRDIENAQAYLETLEAQKEHEVAIAAAALQQLEDDREAALEAEQIAYEAQRKVLEAEALLIDGELKKRAEAVRGYFTKLMAGPNGLPVRMRDAGIRTMQGLLRGLNRIAPQVLGRARQIANEIRRTIEAALAIRSPSRVMERIGVDIGLGLVEGLDASERAVRNASLSLAEQMVVPMVGPNVPGIVSAPGDAALRGRSAAGGTTVINVNVTAPPLTDPAEVGRQVVEAIRKYERRSGSVFVSA